MILGLGTDIVRVARMEEIIARHGERFAEKVLTADELDEYRASRHPARLLAKRFAVKEAALKALGTGVQQGLTLAQVGLGHDALGCPHLILSGAAAARLQALGASVTHVSISDEREYALAVVIVEGDAGPLGRAPA